MRAIGWTRSVMIGGIAAAMLTTAVQADPGTRTLYLVRHGYYDFEDERDAEIGKALVPLGVAQARLVGSRLAAFPVRFSELRSSTLTRARETARVMRTDLDGLAVVESGNLSECTPPTWRNDIMAQTEPNETEECQAQLETAFTEYFVPSPSDDRHDVLVCHGNVIRYFVTRVLGVDPLSWLRMSIGNCSLTVVRVNPDGTMRLLSFGDVGHLPPNLQTGLASGDRALVVPEE